MVIEKVKEIMISGLVENDFTREVAEKGVEEFIASLDEEKLTLLCKFEDESSLNEIKDKLCEIMRRRFPREAEEESRCNNETAEEIVLGDDCDPESISKAIENAINNTEENTVTDDKEFTNEKIETEKTEGVFDDIAVSETEVLEDKPLSTSHVAENGSEAAGIYAEYSIPEDTSEHKKDVGVYIDDVDEKKIKSQKKHVKKQKPSAKWVTLTALLHLGAGIVFLLEMIAIAVFVAVLIAVVGAGVCFSLFGIIYGIVQLFSVVPIGVYEIGFGIIIAGVTMLAGVLIYNFDIRFLPYLMKRTKIFLGKLKKIIKEKYFSSAKEDGVK